MKYLLLILLCAGCSLTRTNPNACRHDNATFVGYRYIAEQARTPDGRFAGKFCDWRIDEYKLTEGSKGTFYFAHPMTNNGGLVLPSIPNK